MITLPVSITSIRSSDAPARSAAGAGEASFGEILDRQVEASPDAGQRGDRGRDDVLATPPGPRLDRRHDAAIDSAPSHALDHTSDHGPAADAVDPAAGDPTDDADIATECATADGADGTDIADGTDGTDSDAAVRLAPACPIAVPLDGVGQSLPAPSGQAPAEPALVAEVAAVSGTAVPAAGSVAAAVDPLTTAAAALPATAATTVGAGAPTGAPAAAGTPGATGDDMPVITGITVETMPAAVPTDPSGPPTTSAVPGGAAPTTFGASPLSSPPGTAPAASADPDVAPAAPVAPTRPAIGDAEWVAAPAVTDDPASTPTAVAATARPAPVPTGGPAAAADTVAVAAAATAAATAATAATASATGDGAADTPRPRDHAATPVRGEAPAGPVTGAGAATAAAAPGASASTANAANAANADGLLSAPPRTGDIAAQAQRDAQIRRAEHLTRLGIDVTTDGLGGIRIEASNAGGGLQLNLGAERASTRHLLAEQVGVLRDELGTNVSVDIGRGGTGHQPTADHGTERRQPGAPLAPAAAAMRPADATLRQRPALSHLVDADRGLDLHL